MNKFKLTCLAAALTVGMSSNALALTSINDSLVNGSNQWSDDFGELWLDVDADNLVSVGDKFVAVMGFTSFPDAPNAFGTYNELTAILAIEVASVNVSNPNPDPACANLVCASMTFGVVGDFNATMLEAAALISAMDGAPYTLGPFTNLDGSLPIDPRAGIVFFEDETPDFIRNGATSLSQSFDSAIDGTAIMIAGMDPVTAATLAGFLPLDPLGIVSVSGGLGIGNITGSFQIIEENIVGYDFEPTVTVSGNLSGTNPIGATAVSTPFPIIGDLTLTLTANAIPEPSMLALLGIGLLGVAGNARKKKA
ncbi:MAG: PEP-CTERM sorting domain-containing protein [Methyloprofundus sp.]|nr:PEP-CTERM sorting domain-containing protein [Methyloprofundus sp.]